MKICKNPKCKKEILNRRGNAKFCSNKCNQAFYDKARHKQKDLNRRPWIAFKKDKCAHCGFVPIHSCQLDVDHIDSNKKNNKPENLQTLCANCHRLKTFVNRDGGYSYYD